ncbi:MAG: hypothetical protein H0U71_04885 [Gammaproteobacteria bacterium]|nr:hypothetical protein [Gammaproteobacteria bacterium]
MGIKANKSAVQIDDEPTYFLSVNAFKDPHSLEQALDTLWRSIKKNESFYTGILCVGIACNIVQVLPKLKLSTEEKFNLLHAALQHPLFTRNPTLVKQLKKFINPYLTFFVKKNNYFPIEDSQNVLQLYEEELLKDSPELKQRVQEEDVLYYKSLNCLSL